MTAAVASYWLAWAGVVVYPLLTLAAIVTAFSVWRVRGNPSFIATWIFGALIALHLFSHSWADVRGKTCTQQSTKTAPNAAPR